MKKLSGGGRGLASAACLAMPASIASARSKCMKSILLFAPRFVQGKIKKLKISLRKEVWLPEYIQILSYIEQ